MASLLAISGCGSDSDKKEPPVVEPPIVVPAPTVTTAQKLVVDITNAQVSGENLIVTFEAYNEEGFGFVGLDSVRLTVVKLIPGANGNASEWQSFINRVKDETEAFPNSAVVTQAYNESNGTDVEGKGTLIDSQNGKYQYTFSADVVNAVDPLTGDAIAWEENLTHRIGLEVRKSDNNPVVNAHFDWVPAGDGVSVTRDIVDIASCNQCHTELAMHGGNRTDTAYCVTCHNPGTPEPISGETADFKVMIHKIHRGASLPSMATQGDGAEYTIYGYRNSAHTYAKNEAGEISGVVFPQDIRNCTNCHVGAEDKLNDPRISTIATTDGDNWKNVPTIEACGSCHDDMAWNDDMLANTAKRKHEALFPATNDDCATCHASGQLFEVEKLHTNAFKDSLASATAITFATTSVTLASNGFNFTVQVKKDGEQLSDMSSISQYFKKGTGEVYVMFNWDNGDGYEASYANNHVKFSSCALASDSDDFICHWDTSTLNNGDPITTGTGVFTFADALTCINHQTNELTDCAATDINGEALEIDLLPAPLSISHFDLSSLATTDDYENKFAADLASCKSCHSADMNIHATRHGANDFTQCTSCHNATRPAYYAGRPADLKYQVHKLHASNDPQGHGAIKFPAELNNCQQCHSEGQIDLPLAQNPRAAATKNPTYAGWNLLDPAASVYTSPTATVCTTCHISVTPGFIDATGKIITNTDGSAFVDENGDPMAFKDNEQDIINHMILAGGAVFGATTAAEATDTEACSTCHAIGKSVGVDKVHGLTD
ncbi:hypothetical protein A9Q98_11085 [Thalassotalea sp. 42_200_T64]|nr:hypothetical protein A9Q98_11085 [Thalassotalea sp. 42_200_T64]